ncbi:precorrin-6y C5,15-methyltransferase (decarboxylating) CbiE subunit [Clostridium algifaecis]|uniref:Precorrin-6y C5,15-methyltransferase (Decarboxylating) CbiE subunit n=1 Tax=Clostridium algifaecis TaxID=1472040 RepID=A0ABS4KR91_9CLOT|nr:precorrin-6y C5,15-methyltransferase (decarboxylating) subunit CbiE [Clostridium algifaecis]MBP2032548.1 precorrin-6y C5,15-methyltransferase (decarboxylating) CbiE subunit [Clostridium algifaecis]
MKKVFVVGIGPGHRDYILPRAVKVMEESDVIVGFSRAIKSLNFINSTKIEVPKLQSILEIINSDKYNKITAAASGDPLFYGITEYINKNYEGELEVVPGISSFQYMMSVLKKSWNNAYTGSVHGRNEEIFDIVNNYRVSIWLTDSKNSPDFICKILYENHIEALVYVGENLSYEDEKIIIGTPEELKNASFENLSVVVIERV